MSGRKAHAIAQIISAREIKEKKIYDEQGKKVKEKQKKEIITPEEHERRMKMLKEIGLLK